MLISDGWIHGFMSNLIKKSWTDSVWHIHKGNSAIPFDLGCHFVGLLLQFVLASVVACNCEFPRKASTFEELPHFVRLCNQINWELDNYTKIFKKSLLYVLFLDFQQKNGIYLLTFTKSLVNTNSFYTNFINTHFQKVPIPHLTGTMKQKFLH